MSWARGALSRVVAELLWETGGEPDGKGVTIDQLVRRVTKQPPPGIRQSAIRGFASLPNYPRLRQLGSEALIHEDGAGGIEILSDPDGNPWFTEAQAYRTLLVRTLAKGVRSGWLIRDGDRWRIASLAAGPQVPGMGTYNAAARARQDKVDHAHAAKVTVRWALDRLDEPALCELVLRHFLSGDRGDVYYRRRRDFRRAVEAIEELTDPEQIREVRMELAGKTVPR